MLLLLNVGGVERLSTTAAALLRVLLRDVADDDSFLSLVLLLLLQLLDSSIPRRPRKASRHLHLQHRRLDVAAVALVPTAPNDRALLLRLRQQLLPPLLLLGTEKEESRESSIS